MGRKSERLLAFLAVVNFTRDWIWDANGALYPFTRVATKHKVTELLTEIAKKRNTAVIIVSHDQRLLDIADRVLWMEDGRVKEGQENLVTDPICEMTLQQALAPYRLTHQGDVYYFCSQKCLTDFKERVRSSGEQLRKEKPWSGTKSSESLE